MSKLLWICDLRAPSGYGRASRADLRALIRSGLTPRVKVSAHDMTTLKFTKDKFWGIHEKAVLSRPKVHPEIVVWQETPEFYKADPTCVNVARLEWETSKIVDYDHSGQAHYNWVEQLNKMTEIWPASQFVADVLKDSGVTTPCHVIPHPVDLQFFTPGERRLIGPTGREVNRNRFTALALFQWTTRKNPMALLTAWCRSSLGKRSDCALILKTYAANFDDAAAHQLRRQIAQFKTMLNIRDLQPNVHPFTTLVPEEEMPGMYRSADVFLHPSHGEGFGMPVSEAAACGLPAIYTNATAHAEFATGYPVDCHRVPVSGMSHIPWYASDQDWWQIDTLDFVEKLEQAYEDWKTGRLKDLGAQARAKVADLHSDERCGAMLRERIDELGRGFAGR
jgi:glycosyltransferase involved in cell wall biosynthesis